MGDKYNESRNQLRYNRISVGLCRDCGAKPFLENKVVCQDCDNKRKVVSLNRPIRMMADGLCIACGKSNQRKDKSKICQDCCDKQVERMRYRRKEIKLFIINHFGNACKECGEKDIRCLSLDHINNDGKLDKTTKDGKRQITPTWYAKLYKMIKGNVPLPRELQLLCFNCHAKKDLSPWWFNDNT